MKLIRLRESELLAEDSVEQLAGTFLDERHYDRVINEDARVEKPDGSPLLVFRRKVLPAGVCEDAYGALRSAAAESDNRGLAGGIIPEGVSVVKGNEPIGSRTKTRWHAAKADGTLSKTNRATPVRSGIVGFFDRNPRFPYCRLTAFNLSHPERFAAAMPFFQAIDAVFAAELPDRYGAQREFIAKTSPDFQISGTVFTTVTVNRNWRTAAHYDRGDLKAGFGVMAVLEAGQYRGGYLVFPRYRIAADMRSCDVLLADVHELHGNTAMRARQPYERISCVLYYREAMHRCGSAEQELDRAKRRRPGEPMYDG